VKLVDENGRLNDNHPEVIAELKKYRDAQKADPDKKSEAALSGTEDEAALEFSCRHAEQLRYVNLWHRWLRWDAVRWKRIDDLSVFHAVRLVAREFAKIYDDKKLGKGAATFAIERIARNDRRHDTLFDAWDIDDEIFNTSERRTAR
jgi:putative DNA primase/helicase